MVSYGDENMEHPIQVVRNANEDVVSDSGQTRLNELGYKQELKRDLS